MLTQRKGKMGCNLFDDIIQQISLINQIFDNTKKYGKIFLNFYNEAF